MLRLAFTLAILLVVRIGSHITVPLFNTQAIVDFMRDSGSFVAILNNFSGQSLERFSILALGISLTLQLQLHYSYYKWLFHS